MRIVIESSSEGMRCIAEFLDFPGPGATVRPTGPTEVPRGRFCARDSYLRFLLRGSVSFRCPDIGSIFRPIVAAHPRRQARQLLQIRTFCGYSLPFHTLT